MSNSDIESLLRAPQLSSESSAVQKALANYLGSSVTLKYPAGGEFLSPFLFGDWDGDGQQEAAALYTSDSAGTNISLAILESNGADSWHVTQSIEGLSSTVDRIETAHLKDADSTQIITGYSSAQGDRYMVVYQYFDELLQPVIQQTYTDYILADITGDPDTEDLILALPTETEAGGINLQLLTSHNGEFSSTQYLAAGSGYFDGCAALTAGSYDEQPYLVVDGWSTASANSIASMMIRYDEESGFLAGKAVEGVRDFYRTSLRYDSALYSKDIDGNGTVDIPQELDDGGTIEENVEKRLKFLLWKDYSDVRGGSSKFGVFDREYNFFIPLPESMHGSARLRANAAGNGWVICNAGGDTVYCELRVVKTGTPSENYTRIASVGESQLQIRMVTTYYGLNIDNIVKNVVFL